jgi:osmotically-inducible protein OsmY
MDDDQLDASEIEVSVEKGEVTLQGHVDSRAAKRRAEDCAEAAVGVSHLQNNLRVRSASGQPSGDGPQA